MAQFQTLEQFHHWLTDQGIDTSTWGTGEAKTVKHLWAEVQRGEITLETDPLRRVIRVVEVIIRRGETILIEAAQELDDQRVRTRDRPPSEKMKPDEAPREGAIRCLQEELGLPRAAITVTHITPEPKKRSMESPSYPGVPSMYIVYTVEAEVDGLPAEDFATDEVNHQPGGDPVRRHYWAWRTPDVS